MKKYKDRIIRKVSKAINIAYLSTAILWGSATIGFSIQRDYLKDKYTNNEITHEEYLDKSMEFSDKEQFIFKSLTTSLVTTFLADLVVSPLEERER